MGTLYQPLQKVRVEHNASIKRIDVHTLLFTLLCASVCVCVSPRQLMLMLSFLVFHILSLSLSVFVLYKISSSLRGLKIISLNDNRIKTIDCTRLILG